MWGNYVKLCFTISVADAACINIYLDVFMLYLCETGRLSNFCFGLAPPVQKWMTFVLTYQYSVSVSLKPRRWQQEQSKVLDKIQINYLLLYIYVCPQTQWGSETHCYCAFCLDGCISGWLCHKVFLFISIWRHFLWIMRIEPTCSYGGQFLILSVQLHFQPFILQTHWMLGWTVITRYYSNTSV